MNFPGDGFHLMRPEWLWALLPAAVLALLLWRARGQSGNWRSVIAPDLLPYLLGQEATATRGQWLLPALLLAWCLAAVAAAGPSWRQIPQPIHQKQDALVLVLDLSYSMRAQDLAPSRIDRARQKLLDLLERRREGVTGLIAYAGDAHIVTPLTDDNPTIANLLPALNPDMMPVPGSDSRAAVELALSLLQSAGIRSGHIVLVTDGVRENDIEPIRSIIGGTGARLSVLGIGTPTGAPIPLPRGGFLKDSEGTIVIPGLEEQPLQSLAQAGGGRYRPLQIDDSDLDLLLSAAELPGETETLALERSADTWEDQGFWLILALLPLTLGLFRRGALATLCLPVLLLGAPERAQAQLWDDLWYTPDQQGQRALQAGDPERASTLFENPDWAGTAAYESGKYAVAVDQFSNNDSADGWYNRGNALARSGALEQAANAYRRSLEVDPDRQDARDNLALVEDLLNQQQQQQQQEQEQKGDQSENQSSEQQQANDDGSQSGQQPENQSGEQSDGQDSSQQQQQGEQEGEQQQEPNQQDGEQSDREREQQQAEGQEAASGQQPEIDMSSLAEDLERDQAMEQWLRRVPDDPSGLLREKFRYESRQRQQQGERKRDESYW